MKQNSFIEIHLEKCDRDKKKDLRGEKWGKCVQERTQANKNHRNKQARYMFKGENGPDMQAYQQIYI